MLASLPALAADAVTVSATPASAGSASAESATAAGAGSATPVSAGSARAESATAAGGGSATPASAEPRATWYGWQVLLTDVGSVSLVAIATQMNGNTVGPVVVGSVGVLGYVFGGPIVHWQHGREFIGYIDFTMRLGVPIVLGQLAASATTGTSGGNCAIVCGNQATDNAFAGVVIGIATSMLVDAVALSWETPVRPAEARAPRLRWAPIASTTRGGATAGVGGTF